MRCVSQTTNLGVRSSNLFGRASISLILNPNFCAIFALLTEFESGEHRGNTASNLVSYTLRHADLPPACRAS
jgi:hypothetical protein